VTCTLADESPSNEDWIGGSTIERPNYVPPPPERLPELLNELQAYLLGSTGRALSQPVHNGAGAHANWISALTASSRPYVVKNADGTPKRDPVTKQLVTDVIVQQRLLPKGRKHDDLRLEYDVSAARVQLQEITRLLKVARNGQIPVVRYDPFHGKSE
jgi:hypothetical protein